MIVRILLLIITLTTLVLAAASQNPAQAPLLMDGHVHMTNRVYWEGIDPWKPQPVGDFDYARARQASAIVRGVRGGADLEYERQMADTNRHLNSSIDTVFLTPSPSVAHISSTLVRDIASLGGSVHGLVPDAVEAAVSERMLSGRSPRTQQV